MDYNFNPQSLNAQLATIIERQREAAERDVQILEQVRATNGRVTKLETWRAVLKGQTVLIGSLAGGIFGFIGWAVSTWISHK